MKSTHRTGSALIAEPAADAPALEAHELTKTYGKGEHRTRALNGVSVAAAPGRVLGLLGPNGAGKSTTVTILTTLARADSGTARVGGFDVVADPARVRSVIGYVPQRPSFDVIATGRENLVLQGRVCGLTAAEARVRAAELLARFGLGEAADRRTGTWSGGMARKLDVALGLMHRPRVLFLDEPTTGLDPQARAELWDQIAALRDEGVAVLLTTHYLDEADRLADDLVIVDRGRVVAAGTPDRLKAELAGDSVVVGVADTARVEDAQRALAAVPGVRAVRTDGSVVRALLADADARFPAVLSALEQARVPLANLTVARPSLDEVYLRHAGRSYDAAGDGSGAQGVAA